MKFRMSAQTVLAILRQVFLGLMFAGICFEVSMATAKVAKNDPFPKFQLQFLDTEKSLDLQSLQGKVVLVDFWASWCEPCKISMPFLQKMAKKYEGKVEVVGINVDAEKKDAHGFLKEHPAPNISFLSDAKNEFVKRVGVSAMPSSFILDKKGNVKVVHQGFRAGDESKLESEIKKLLKDK